MTTAPPLQIESLVKRFGTLVAVNGISLEVRDSECLGLLGPNGAGKSTTIRSIVGRVHPDSGSVRIFGHAAESTEARAAIGWVPQELALYPLLTCRENLDSFGRYQGLSGKKLTDAIDWCLRWATLGDKENEPVKQLSGGMKRRLNMACGLIHRPRVVLMDEPTVGVDPQARNNIFEMIEALRKEGMAIIYTTHYMEEAERCDRIGIMHQGKLVAIAPPGELKSEVGGDVIVIRTAAPETLQRKILARFKLKSQLVDGAIRIEKLRAHELVRDLIDAFGEEVESVSFGKPTLEDVFVHLTGHQFFAHTPETE